MDKIYPSSNPTVVSMVISYTIICFKLEGIKHIALNMAYSFSLNCILINTVVAQLIAVTETVIKNINANIIGFV